MTDNVPPVASADSPEVVPSAGVAALAAAVESPSKVTFRKLEKELADATQDFKTTHPLARLAASKKEELDKLEGTKQFFLEKVKPTLDSEKDNDYYRIFGEKLDRAITGKIEHTKSHHTKLTKKQKLDPVMQVMEGAVDDCNLELSDWEGYHERNESPYDEESSDEED